MERESSSTDRRVILSTMWIFYVLNIIYADVLNLMGGEASTGNKDVELINSLMSPEMLLVSAIFLELAIVMVILARVLNHGINRWANIVIAILHTLGLLASVFVGTPTIFYLFFVFVEVATLSFIAWYAWSWKQAGHTSPVCA